MFTFFKNATWLHTIFIHIHAMIHPMIGHNVGKHSMIRKALHHTAIERIPGAYAEFGVYEGTSLLAAVKNDKAMRKASSARFYKDHPARHFYGFDAFEQGFRYETEKDDHPFFIEGDFSSSYDACQARMKSYKHVTLVPGYFEQSLQDKDFYREYDDGLAVVFIDCDLYHPALLALRYCQAALTPGSVVILDDYYSYKGDPAKGVCGAWQQFLSDNPTIKTREFHPYGYTGMSFIIYDVGGESCSSVS